MQKTSIAPALQLLQNNTRVVIAASDGTLSPPALVVIGQNNHTQYMLSCAALGRTTDENLSIHAAVARDLLSSSPHPQVLIAPLNGYGTAAYNQSKNECFAAAADVSTPMSYLVLGVKADFTRHDWDDTDYTIICKRPNVTN